MSETAIIEISLGVLTILCGLIGWLLDNKDQKQAKLIDALFEKHDEDVKRLQALELDIARRYYIKDELDHRFDGLERTIKDGMERMAGRFDDLNKTIIHRLAHGNGNAQ